MPKSATGRAGTWSQDGPMSHPPDHTNDHDVALVETLPYFRVDSYLYHCEKHVAAIIHWESQSLRHAHGSTRSTVYWSCRGDGSVPSGIPMGGATLMVNQGGGRHMLRPPCRGDPGVVRGHPLVPANEASSLVSTIAPVSGLLPVHGRPPLVRSVSGMACLIMDSGDALSACHHPPSCRKAPGFLAQSFHTIQS